MLYDITHVGLCGSECMPPSARLVYWDIRVALENHSIESKAPKETRLWLPMHAHHCHQSDPHLVSLILINKILPPNMPKCNISLLEYRIFGCELPIPSAVFNNQVRICYHSTSANYMIRLLTTAESMGAHKYPILQQWHVAFPRIRKKCICIV